MHKRRAYQKRLRRTDHGDERKTKRMRHSESTEMSIKGDVTLIANIASRSINYETREPAFDLTIKHMPLNISLWFLNFKQ